MARGGTHNTSQLAVATRPPQWLISLKSQYAGRIKSGDKRYEFRRVRMNAQVGDTVLVYESYPTKRVTAQFVVGEASQFGITVQQALKLEKPGEARKDLAEYLAGAKTVTALEITELDVFATPQTLKDATGLERGPMSYQRL